MSETTETIEKVTMSLVGATLLTDSKPREIKGSVWAKQATADMLANTEDLKYPFKTSSLVCPFCSETVTGTETEGARSSKKKPWEITLEELHHTTENKNCPIESFRRGPYGTIIEKILLCHHMTRCATNAHSNTDNNSTIHDDPSIPKIHSFWEEEDCEKWQELLNADIVSKEKKDETISLIEEDEQELAKSIKGLPTVPSGHVQRVLPYYLPKEADSNWEEVLRTFPTWSETNPEDPEAPAVTGWVVCKTEKGIKTLCGYILPGASSKTGDTVEIEMPEEYGVPIFKVLGPDQLLEKHNISQIPYIDAEVVCGPCNEGLAWEEAATVRKLKKREKALKKQRVSEELEKLPKDKIWEGFKEVFPEKIQPELDRPDEPPQMLKGYRPGGDVKKWWLPGIGNPHAKIWIIGLYPSNEEIKRKGGPKILSGPSGEELFALVKEAGLDIGNDVFFENIVKRYLPPKSKIGTELKAEQTWLLKKQLAEFKPDRVICLGADVYRELVGGKSFQDARGTWVEASYPKVSKDSTPWHGRIAGTFHPAGVLRPEGRHNLELFRHDMKELLLDKPIEDVNPTITEITTLDGVKAWVENEIKELEGRDREAIYSLDTESFSLDAQKDELLCLQISKLVGTFHRGEKRLIVEEVPKHSDIIIFQENPEPEIYDADVFLDEEEDDKDQLDLFGLGSNKPKDSEEVIPEKKARVVALANDEEEKKEILETHAKKRKGRDLVLFVPYKKINHLKGLEFEVGALLNKLASHPRCVGFVITNANHDRIRLENFLGWDLSLPAKNGGLHCPLDTILLEHILDENTDLGLKACLNRHFNWPRQDGLLDQYSEEFGLEKIKGKIKDPDRQSVWSLYPWRILKPYAAKDSFGSAALLERQLELLDLQILKYQKDRITNGNSNTLENAFHIQCGAINGTYEMNRYGMPVGKKGMDILKNLTSFYSKHEARMIEQYQDAVFKLTGLRNANPSSPEELSFVLFNENSPLKKQGIEPWKESGKNGRLWSEIPKEERKGATASTDAESLEIIASNCSDPELQHFLLKLSETKTILTIRASFLPDLDSKKGIIGRINPSTLAMHTTYTPTLDTNRCRSIPNLSTFPKEEVDIVEKILGERPPHKIREIIQAPPGAWLLNRDWTTAEVLGVGYLSQDENMLKIISQMNEGMDFHCKLAIKTYNKIQETFDLVEKHPVPPTDWLNSNFQEKERIAVTEFWKKAWEKGVAPKLSEAEQHKIAKKLFKQERSNIKPVTFGVPYGREAPAIMKALNREYYVNDTRDATGEIVKITIEEAQSMIDSYKTEFPSAWGYLVSQAEHGKAHGFLRDHWGFVRHFPQGMKEGDLTRKAYNYQIQHIVAVLMNQAMNDWTEIRKRENLKSYAYATLYDNIGWVVYEDELQKVWDISQQVMTHNRPVGPVIGDLPILNDWRIPTEGDLSQSWDGKSTKPEDLGIDPHPEYNLTGLEGKF
jgi:uracil-DNA glycosylase family 4